MFVLVNKQRTPIAIYDNLKDLLHSIEERIHLDFAAFMESHFYGGEPFPLETYLDDMTIEIIPKNNVNWVAEPYEEIDVPILLNPESSGIIVQVEDYNSSVSYS